MELNSKLILVTGGARSGKSRHALTLGTGYRRKAYLATGVSTDDEMRERIARHKRERGPKWQTLEEPLDLSTVIEQAAEDFDLILIDCLTFWISNLLLKEGKEHLVAEKIAQLKELLTQRPCSFIVVSNEVGMGIVPDNSVSRLFRDLVGFANQEIAKVADQAIFMVAGFPMEFK